MNIKRTFKPVSLRAGQVEMVDEAKLREVLGQTKAAQHQTGECPTDYCSYCPEPAMRRFEANGRIETFFSIFELQQ